MKSTISVNNERQMRKIFRNWTRSRSKPKKDEEAELEQIWQAEGTSLGGVH